MKPTTTSLRLQRQVRIKRRLLACSVLVLLAGAYFGITLTKQYFQLKEAHKEQKSLHLALKEVKREEQRLQEELVRLNDDEYIADLARIEFFFSKEQEILFVLPKSKKP
ncbi:FtsB family cell division protein [Cytobacillus spartinae]